jgi:hypothetical protein
MAAIMAAIDPLEEKEALTAATVPKPSYGIKIESAVPAPVDGTVKELRCRPGDQVAKDEILVPPR